MQLAPDFASSYASNVRIQGIGESNFDERASHLPRTCGSGDFLRWLVICTAGGSVACRTYQPTRAT